MMPGLPVSSIP
jgi:hypothetical protein